MAPFIAHECPQSSPLLGSLPIRAPPTLDDSEFDVSSNGTVLSDSGFESEGFVSGEEFETASPRPLVNDPEAEAEPLDTGCEEEDGSADVDECSPLVQLPNMYNASLRVMPFARLSSYDDEEEVVSEVEDSEELSVVRVPSIDFPESFVPRIKVLDVEEEELEPLILRGSLPVKQSFLEDDESMVQEHGVDDILEDSEAHGECSISIDKNSILQYMQNNSNYEQFGVVKVAADELEKEGMKLDGIDRPEGGTIKFIETDEVSMNHIMQRKLEVDTKESTEIVEGTSIIFDDTSLLKYNIEDYNNSKILELNIYDDDLQLQNFQSQICSGLTGEPVSDSFAGNGEYTGREPIFCLPSQRTAANGSQGFTLNLGSEHEKLISETKCAIDSEAELHDSSASPESADNACEGNKIQNVESLKFLEPEVLHETVCLENDLSGTVLCASQEDELSRDYCSQEHMGKCLNLGDTVEEDGNVDSNTISQELKGDASASDGDAEGLTLVGLEHFMEQISALSIVLSSKGSGKNSQQELTVRSSQEKMNLPMGDAKKQVLYAASSCDSDGSMITITSADEPRLLSLNGPATFSSLPKFEAQTVLGHNVSESEKEKVEKIQALSVKFLRLVQRLNLSLEDSFVSEILCRLVADIRSCSNQEFVIKSAKILAQKLQKDVEDHLDFSLNILVLGKSGVGKSATINSIFGEMKVITNAFEPATNSITEVSGTIDGIKIRILDTPGLRSPVMEQAFNRKILSSIKRHIRKFPPDVILYVDRVDARTNDLNDLPLLRSITHSLNPSIWQRVILTLTHAASTPLDGPSGSPLSYDVFVAQKSHFVQQLISQAVGDLCQINPSFMCPVSLVENHPLCGRNRYGECVLPNGFKWRSQLLGVCFSLKVLCEVSSVSMSGPQTLFDNCKHFFFQNHSPPLDHILSTLPQAHGHMKFSAI